MFARQPGGPEPPGEVITNKFSTMSGVLSIVASNERRQDDGDVTVQEYPDFKWGCGTSKVGLHIKHVIETICKKPSTLNLIRAQLHPTRDNFHPAQDRTAN